MQHRGRVRQDRDRQVRRLEAGQFDIHRVVAHGHRGQLQVRRLGPVAADRLQSERSRFHGDRGPGHGPMLRDRGRRISRCRTPWRAPWRRRRRGDRAARRDSSTGTHHTPPGDHVHSKSCRSGVAAWTSRRAHRSVGFELNCGWRSLAEAERGRARMTAENADGQAGRHADRGETHRGHERRERHARQADDQHGPPARAAAGDGNCRPSARGSSDRSGVRPRPEQQHRQPCAAVGGADAERLRLDAANAAAWHTMSDRTTRAKHRRVRCSMTTGPTDRGDDPARENARRTSSTASLPSWLVFRTQNRAKDEAAAFAQKAERNVPRPFETALVFSCCGSDRT